MTPEAFLDNLARFWGQVDRRGPDDCWPWLGEVNNMGYGRFTFWDGKNRRRVLAHRLALKLSGAQLGDDQVAMHSCDSPPCCNPGHLRAATQAANLHDAHTKGRLNLSGLELGSQARWGTHTKESA